MKDIKLFVHESFSPNKDLDEAIEEIKHYLIVKQNYKEDDFRITKAFGGNEIRVYFPNESRDDVYKKAQPLIKVLNKAHLKVSWKTFGRNDKGEYYQAFK